MRSSLRVLLMWLTLGPPLLAIAWWSILWLLGQRPHPTLHAVLIAAWLYGAVAGPFLLYGELIRMVCGPGFIPHRGRKTRRKVRVRIERYADGTT
jgi:hypothetical protein